MHASHGQAQPVPDNYNAPFAPQKDTCTMNDQTDSPEPSEIEANQVKVVRIDRIIVAAGRRPLDEYKIAELMDSIQDVGHLQPIPVVARKGDEQLELQLVGGWHRLEACKRLGRTTIQCTVLSYDDDLLVELAQIDENLIRNDPSPAEHADLTGRRKRIITQLAAQDGTLSQLATASKQSQRRAGQKTGPDTGSSRDQANKTGESKDRIQRSNKRFEALGSALLTSIVGTSLDTGVELDALAELPVQVRAELVKRATAGDAVSAKKELRRANRRARGELEQSPVNDLEDAFRELYAWLGKYRNVLEVNGLGEHMTVFYSALFNAVYPANETDAEQMASEPTKKNWFWQK